MITKSEIPNISGVVEIIRENTRRTIAHVAIYGYFGILGMLVLFGRKFLNLSFDEMIKVFTTTAGILGGVVGAVIGFYFQSEKTNS